MDPSKSQWRSARDEPKCRDGECVAVLVACKAEWTKSGWEVFEARFLREFALEDYEDGHVTRLRSTGFHSVYLEYNGAPIYRPVLPEYWQPMPEPPSA